MEGTRDAVVDILPVVVEGNLPVVVVEDIRDAVEEGSLSVGTRDAVEEGSLFVGTRDAVEEGSLFVVG